MELYNGLLSRRSIRHFTGDPVTAGQVDQLVRAAMYAPSARNTQPWHFVVVDDKDRLIQFSEFHPYAKMLPQADKAILVCGDTALENTPGYWMVDCANATQNVLLAAHGLGLGAVWLGIYPRKKRMEATTQLFHLPETIRPLALVALGVPAHKPERPERYRPERIHYNKW